MAAFIDLRGMKFGRWTVLGYAKPRYWHCQCVCGTKGIIHGSSLTSGGSSSCGCYQRERRPWNYGQKGGKGNAGATRKHGEAISRTPEYSCWVSVRFRCDPASAGKCPNYAGRGIKVCDRWRDSYENFLADMGRRPSDAHSLDRIDVDGDYSPTNCRWATSKVQMNNRRPFKAVDNFTTKQLEAELAKRLKASGDHHA